MVKVMKRMRKINRHTRSGQIPSREFNSIIHLIDGMDEDGRAIVADTEDRKWFESDQRFKLTDIDELISYIDEGYIIIRDVQ